MNSKIIANGILRAVAILFGVVILGYFIYSISAVIGYLAIAAVLSLIGHPIVTFLTHKLKFGTTLAALISIFILVGLLVGLVVLFVPLIIEQGQKLSLLNINQLQSNFIALYNEFTQYFNINNSDIQNSLKDWGMLSKLNLSFIPTLINSIINGLGSFSIGLFAVLFISFFFLKDSKLFENGILTFAPSQNESLIKTSFIKIKDLLSRYFIGLIFQILILFIIYTIGLLIVGVENAATIAFLCALLNLIPYVGPIISIFLMVALTLTSFLNTSFSEVMLPKAFGVCIVFLVGQLVDNFFSQPFIFSKSVKSHPLEIFLVILITGILFGVLGLILAVPVYTALKVILKTFLSNNSIVIKLTKNL